MNGPRTAVLVAGLLLCGLACASRQSQAAQPAGNAPDDEPVAPSTTPRPQPGDSDVMVLVVNAGSPVQDLDAIDLKRLFLGIPVVASGVNLRGVLNFSDARLQDLFYQHVVGMTGDTYERRTLELTLEQGRRMPAKVADMGILLATLRRDALAVSFAWRSQVAARTDLRIVRELWHP